MPDLFQNTTSDPLEWLRLKCEENENRKTLASSRQALDSFSRFIGGAEIGFADFNRHLIGEWTAYLLFNGYSLKTASYYIKRLASLYGKAVAEGMAEPSGAFAEIQARLNAPESARFDGTIDKDSSLKLLKLYRTPYSGDPLRQLARDMLLFAVFNGGLSFEELLMYTKDGYTGNNPHITEIVSRYAKPKNKFLFPLDRHSKNTRQLVKTVENLIRTALSGINAKVSPSPSDTPLNLWCAAAMNCGFPAADIAACVQPRNGASALTAFVEPSDADSGQLSLIRDKVIEVVAHNPVNWYVMRFRRKVTRDMVDKRLKERGINLTDIYYPMEEIIRKVGKRNVFEKRPVISWLMFFQTRVTELNNIFHNIGDLAWGYRRSREVNSPYAAISPKEIYALQTAIGTFSADTQLHEEGDLELHPGDRIVVIGGLLKGRPATYESSMNAKDKDAGSKTIYRILLDGGQYRDWVVDEDPRLVRKITESQFAELHHQYSQEEL